MTCIINNHKFTLEEGGIVQITAVSNLHELGTFRFEKQNATQKDFEKECSYWYFDNVMR